jgi:DNA-binding protein HU-beta
MTKAFISEVLRESCELTHAGSHVATNDLISAIIEKLKRDGKFVLPGFGTFTVVKLKAGIKMNPRTQEKIKVTASKTVRFKVSPSLKKIVTASRQQRGGSRSATSAGRQSNRKVSPDQDQNDLIYWDD